MCLSLMAIAASPLAARAQVAPERLRVGEAGIPLLWSSELLTPAQREQLAAPGPNRSATGWADAWWSGLRSRLTALGDTLWLTSLALDKLPPSYRIVRRAARDTSELVPGMRRPVRKTTDILPGVLSNYADLDLQVDGQSQMTARWETFSPCTLGAGQRCNSSGIPTLAPDAQFRAIAKGTISDRVHVDVDFDDTREFQATNNVSVYYQGKPDEIVQRVELGEVTMPLPRSQFISQGIPAGNFGVRTVAQIGPLNLQGVFAQQKGNVQNRDITLDLGGGGTQGQGVLQDFDVVLDDGGYQPGQFFFVVDPRAIAGFPFFDVLSLQGAEVPDSLRPTSSLKLYRHEVRSGTQQQNIDAGVIQARAVITRSPGEDPSLPDSTEFQGFFRPLVEGQDFIVHRSGLWVVLRSRVLDQEALAVTYITASGDTVGDFDAEAKFRQLTNTGQGQLPRLILLKDTDTHRPGGLTWEREMHNIYRISSSDDVEQGSVELTISQGEIESGPIIRTINGNDFSFLEIFGLDDQPRDDQVDAARIWRPRNGGDFAGNTVIAGSYLVFPAVEPFLDPPPLRSSRVPGLQGQPFPLSEGDRSRSIYEEPNDQTRATSSLYRLNLHYRSRSSGRKSSFSLGAVGIRDGSERVTLNGTELKRDRDYQIDYDIGQLTLLRPEDLFSPGTTPSLKVRFEQKAIFQLARKNILALTGGIGLSDWGRISFVGLSQTESSVLNRPDLGLEPGGIKLGGITGEANLNVPSLTRLMNALPGSKTDLPSHIAIEGELATSLPTTNRFGTTFVDDFEGSSGFRVSLFTRAWRFGSMPTRPEVDGTQDFLPPVLDASNRLGLVWQNQWINGNLTQGPLLTEQVDPALRVSAGGRQENVLWITLNRPPAAGGNGWASITTSLSESGLDLTTSEFLEFYASVLDSPSPNLALIIDVGTVSEDAFVLDSLGAAAGLGVLDQEADPIVGVWGNQDDTGLWGQGCRAEPQVTGFPLGDARANCANNNGLEDTEDLNRDNFLNTDERFFRYIVPLAQTSRFLDRVTGGEFLFNRYRIPLRDPDLREILTDQGLQNIRNIRITLVADRPTTVLLSRMEFTGSRWLKRGGTGNVVGLGGELPGNGGTVTVGPISTRDGSYVSPPGVNDQRADRTSEFQLSGQLFNEQSLRLNFDDLPAHERVEVFRRFSETTRNFLQYREGRLWALPAKGDWGVGGPLRVFVKLGFDNNNFYLYRTPRPQVPAVPGKSDWLPEIRIDFERWIELRTAAEQIILNNPSGTVGDSSLVLWDVDVLADGDSTYAIVIQDRSRAPNLSAIREMALGVENVSGMAAGAGELWLDDLRLDRAADDHGVAGRGSIALDAAGILSVKADYQRQNPFFRQLGGSPDFESNWSFDSRTNLQFGRFLPFSWGLAMPMSFQYSRLGDNPFFLPQTDVRASEIGKLRTGSARRTQFNVALSKNTRSGSPILRSTLDGLQLSYSRGSIDQVTTQSTTAGTNWTASMSWGRDVSDHSFALLPGFLKGFIDVLPGFLSHSTALTNLKNLRFRWTPRSLGLGNSLARSNTELRRFQSSIRRSTDAGATPSVHRDYSLRSNAGISLQPFPSLSASVNASSDRDLVRPALRVTGRSATALLREQSRKFLGLRIGWETARNITNRISYTPRLASWFDPSLNITTGYRTGRQPSYVLAVGNDTVLARDMRMNRDTRLGVTIQPDRFATAFGVPEKGHAHGLAGGVRSFWDHMRPVRINWSRRINASFDRRSVTPTFGDQFVTKSLDGLRFSGADTASSAGSNRDWSVEGGYRLPFNLEATVRFSSGRNRVLTALSERGTRDQEWPNVNLEWRRVPLPGLVQRAVRTMSLSGGIRDRDLTTITSTGQDFGENQKSHSIGALLIFANGFNLSYKYDLTRIGRTDATGFSKSNRGSHDVRVTGTVAPPDAWSFLQRPLRLSLAYTRNGNLECRDLGGAGFQALGDIAALFGTDTDCISHVDQTTQNASFTLDTEFTGYSLGIQFNWVQRSSDVGRQQRTNQYNLNIFGRFFFQAERPDAGP